MKILDRIFVKPLDGRLYMLEFEYFNLEEENFLLKFALHEIPGYGQDSEYGLYPEYVLDTATGIKNKLKDIFNEADSEKLLLLLRIHHLEFKE